MTLKNDLEFCEQKFQVLLGGPDLNLDVRAELIQMFL